MRPKPRFGLSFNPRRAAELQLDPTEAFLAVLIHLKARLVRLPLSWDDLEPEPGRYELDRIRWYLDRAEEYGCRVVLTAGIRDWESDGSSLPLWLRVGSGHGQSSASTGQGRLLANVLLMLERVVAALADYDAIDAWQVEHEPFSPNSHARGGVSISPTLVRREAEVVREVDSRHRPVVVTYSAGSIFDRRWRVALGIADIIGENLAFTPGLTGAGWLKQSIRERVLAGRLRLLALAAARQGKPLWITDLPTVPPARVSASDSRLREDEPRLTSDLLSAGIDRSARSGAARIYLRGAETWLLRMRNGDARCWQLARKILAP